MTLHGPDGAGEPNRDAEPRRAETPTERIVAAANSLEYVTDKNGRRIGFKRLTMLDSMDLEALAGPALASNEPWMAKAMVAFAVAEIDGKRVPKSNTMRELRAVIQRLGDEGMVALLIHLSSAAAETARAAERNRMAEIEGGDADPDAQRPRLGEDMTAAKN